MMQGDGPVVSQVMWTAETMPQSWYLIPLDGTESFGQLLRRLRLERGAREGREITQREVALAIGCEPEKQNVISKYESGSIKQPGQAVVEALADYFEVDVDRLMLAAYRSGRGRPRNSYAVPRNSYAVPGDPVLIRHLELLREMDITEIEEATREMAQKRLDARKSGEVRRRRETDAG